MFLLIYPVRWRLCLSHGVNDSRPSPHASRSTIDEPRSTNHEPRTTNYPLVRYILYHVFRYISSEIKKNVRDTQLSARGSRPVPRDPSDGLGNQALMVRYFALFAYSDITRFDSETLQSTQEMLLSLFQSTFEGVTFRMLHLETAVHSTRRDLRKTNSNSRQNLSLMTSQPS